MENDNKKITKIAIFIFTLIIVVIGSTYAFFEFTANNSSIAGESNCYTVNYVKGQEISEEIEPVADYTSGESTDLIMYSDSSCSPMSGTLYITTTNNSTMDFSDEALRYTVVVNGEVVSEGAVNGTTNQVIYDNFKLNTTSTTYQVYVWLDASREDTTNTNDETFSGFIHAKAVATSDVLSPSQTTLTNLGLMISQGTPDFTKTSCSSGCEEATVGLYEYEDDLGTSYYFRGDVENNYVKFGKNASGQDMYWRIIRINGDGTVRIIYDGTQAWENGVSSENRQIGTSVFNTSANDNAYVGYMFGQIGVTTTGTEGYNLTHSNDNNSIIKTYLEGELASNNTGWYYENIIATGYHQYVADAIYCNDRNLDLNNGSSAGISDNVTNYNVYERLWENYTTNVEPHLTCTNKNDRFTISNSTLAPIDGLGTNKKLKYPVGLITADEVVLAGGKRATNNTQYYLYCGDLYWTMSPSRFYIGGSTLFHISSFGNLYLTNGAVDSTLGVRPVISLHSDVLKYGNGTIGNEFRLSVE